MWGFGKRDGALCNDWEFGKGWDGASWAGVSKEEKVSGPKSVFVKINISDPLSPKVLMSKHI